MENIADTIQLKFPIGEFVKKDEYSAAELSSFMDDIEKAPARYMELAQGIAAESLGKTYRTGSWNIQQLYHHVADIQLLHFFRMKKAITEDDYKNVTLIDMNEWATTKDGFDAPIEDSLIMLDGLTKRYHYLIKSLTKEQLEITYHHPVRGFDINQAQAIAMSAWHLNHHLAHIRIALKN